MHSVLLEVALLHNQDPATYLPHRFPFLMLDRIIELLPGVSATAEKQVTYGRQPFLQLLMLEAIAQLGGIVSVDQKGEGGFLAAVDNAEFSGVAKDGDTLTISARVVKSFGRLFLIEGEVNSGKTCLLKACMTLGIGKL